MIARTGRTAVMLSTTVLSIGACADGSAEPSATPSIATSVVAVSTVVPSAVQDASTTTPAPAVSSSSAPPPSSGPPASEVSTSTSTTSPTPSTSVPVGPSDPVDLADWPIPAADEPIRTAPAYLPSANAPDAVDLVRFSAVSPRQDQVFDTGVWIDVDVDAAIVVTTRIPWAPTVPLDARTPLDTASWATSWDEAFFSPTGEGITAIKLFDADAPGVFEVRTYGLEESIAVDIAATARRVGPGEAGWILGAIPDGFIQFGPTNEHTAETRFAVWANGPGRPKAEVQISTDPSNILSAYFQLGNPARVDVNGHPGISFGGDGRAAVVWEPETGVFVVAAAEGSVADVLEVARSTTPVDEATWNAATVEPFGDYTIVCTSIFC